MYSKHAHTFSTSSHKHIRKTHIQHHTQTHTQREIEKYSRAKACREAIPKFGQHLATSSEVSSVQCTNERKTLKTALSLKINKTKTKPSCKKQRRARRERERAKGQEEIKNEVRQLAGVKPVKPVCLLWCLLSWSERENLRPQSVNSHW